MIIVENLNVPDKIKMAKGIESRSRITITEKWALGVTVWKDKSITFSVIKNGEVVSTSTYC